MNGARHTQLFDLLEKPEEIRDLSAAVEFEPVIMRLRSLLLADKVRLHDGNTEFPFTDRQGKEFRTTFERGQPQQKVPSPDTKPG